MAPSFAAVMVTAAAAAAVVVVVVIFVTIGGNKARCVCVHLENNKGKSDKEV